MFWDVKGTTTKPSPLWTYSEKNIFSTWYLEPYDFVTCGDILYIGGDRLTALDIKTGKELWETQLKNSLPNENEVTFVLHPIVYGDKIVAIGARLVVEKGSDYYFERRNIISFDRETGKLLWKSVDIGSKTNYFEGGSPVVLNDKIYVPALNGEYRASKPGYGGNEYDPKEERGIWVFDINTGKVLRKTLLHFDNEGIDPELTSIRSYENNIYLETLVENNLYLIAFDTLHNKLLWQTKVTDNILGDTGVGTAFSNSFAINNRVITLYISTSPSKSHGEEAGIEVFDRLTGKLLWKKPTAHECNALVLTEDKLIAQIEDNTFACIDPLTGKENWTCRLPKPTDFGEPETPNYVSFITNDVLYIADYRTIIALSLKDGKENWKISPHYDKFNKNDWVNIQSFIPVDKGFVLMYANFGNDSDNIIVPPVIQLWMSK
jgi:outer membrane protein assembly factor BamB